MGKLKKIGHFFGEVRAAPVSSPQGALTGLNTRRDWAAQTTPSTVHPQGHTADERTGVY